MKVSLKGYFAVRKGRKPGVYSTWEECAAQTAGYSGAKWRKFMYKSHASSYVNKMASNGRNKSLNGAQECSENLLLMVEYEIIRLENDKKNRIN